MFCVCFLNSGQVSQAILNTGTKPSPITGITPLTVRSSLVNQNWTAKYNTIIRSDCSAVIKAIMRSLKR